MLQIRKEALWACFAMEPKYEAMISVSHFAKLVYIPKFHTSSVLVETCLMEHFISALCSLSLIILKNTCRYAVTD